MTKAVFAGLFACTSLGVIAGASVNSWLMRRGVKPKAALDLALSLTALAALALLGVSLAGLGSAATVAGLAFFYFLAMGVIFPNAMHEAVHPLPDIAAMASAVLLSSQMLFGALGGAWARPLPERLAARDRRGDDRRRHPRGRPLRAMAEAERRSVKNDANHVGIAAGVFEPASAPFAHPGRSI